MNQLTEGPRARYRRQVRDEVRARAWEQISQDGACALSLKTIATQMGMTAPALYRYYSSRDELLTELILGAYEDLAERTEMAAQDGNLLVGGDLRRDSDLSTDGALPEDGVAPGRQLTAIANSLRRWAVAQPQRYLLLYGTPVPGYHAPDAATEMARRIFAPILAAFTRFARDTTGRAEAMSPGQRAVTFWTRLHGVLSLELAGHFVGMDIDPEQLYESEIRSVVGSDA